MSVMSQVREHVDQLPVGAFVHSRDLVAQLGERTAVDLALHRLGKADELVAVRRGLYYKGEKTAGGRTHPDALSVGYEVARAAGYASGFGPAERTALEVLGLAASQKTSSTRALSAKAAPPVPVTVSVPGRTPANTPDVRFVARSAVARTRLAPLEVAVLEVLATLPEPSGRIWSRLLAHTAAMERAGAVSTRAIAEVAVRERHLATRDHAERLYEEVSTHA